jgi:hypothetical protein
MQMEAIFMFYRRFKKDGSSQKMGNTKVTHHGMSFASKLEAAVYDLITGMDGVTDIKQQVHVYMTDARIGYIPDFSFILNGELCFAEAKGFETDVFKIKKRLWKHYGAGKLYIYKGSYKNPKLDEIVTVTSMI